MQLVRQPIEKRISKDFKYFILYDNDVSCLFYDNAEFDCYIGAYPILDKNKKVVSYMDLLGNFTDKPTEFSKDFYDYVSQRDVDVAYEYPYVTVLFTSLIDFPAKYMANDQIKELVIAEEEYKIKKVCKETKNLILRLRCKKYLKRVLNKKLKEAKEFAKQNENNLDVEKYFNL